MVNFDVTKHSLVPSHTKVSAKDKDELLHKYALKDFPKILITDPAIAHLEAQEGDIIKIVRQSSIAGEHIFYRRVCRA